MNATETTTRSRIEESRRRRHLASDRRTGAYSRREIRAREIRWLRHNWLGTVAVSALTLTIAVAIHLIAAAPVAPYLIGALVASAGWWIYTMMLELSGVTAMRSGVTGEEWTAEELRKLRRQGWIVVNHVMMVNADVDHVVLGRGGMLAVETKFRSDWGRGKQELDGIARAAVMSAHNVGVRLRRKARDVHPLVVMWGPDVMRHFPNALVHAGVTFCPGHQVGEYLLSLPERVADDEVQAAFVHLDRYVQKRDSGEERAQGPLPRTFADLTNDAFAAAIGALASAFAVVTPVNVPPQGLWSLAAAASIAATATLARRRWRHSKRAQRVAGAIVWTCAVLGALLLLVILAAALF